MMSLLIDLQYNVYASDGAVMSLLIADNRIYDFTIPTVPEPCHINTYTQLLIHLSRYSTVSTCPLPMHLIVFLSMSHLTQHITVSLLPSQILLCTPQQL